MGVDSENIVGYLVPRAGQGRTPVLPVLGTPKQSLAELQLQLQPLSSLTTLAIALKVAAEARYYFVVSGRILMPGCRL